MLRKSAIALTLCMPLLAGCASTGGSIIPGMLDPRIEQVRQEATKLCGYLPTATTVSKIIASFFGGSETVDVVLDAARGICDAVSVKSFRRSAAPAKYRGVAIKGQYLGRR